MPGARIVETAALDDIEQQGEPKHVAAFMVVSTFKEGTVMDEVFADDADGAATCVRSLPMAKWWDLDIVPLGAPTVPGGAS